MDFVVTEASEAYIPDIEAIEKRVFSAPWTREQLRAQLKAGHIFLAAVRGGHAVGYVGLQYVLDEGYISNIAVSPECRRMGVADALLNELEKKSRERKLAFMTLEVRAGNAGAVRLYEKHGFKKVGERRGYYSAPKEDAIIMTVELRRE